MKIANLVFPLGTFQRLSLGDPHSCRPCFHDSCHGNVSSAPACAYSPLCLSFYNSSYYPFLPEFFSIKFPPIPSTFFILSFIPLSFSTGSIYFRSGLYYLILPKTCVSTSTLFSCHSCSQEQAARPRPPSPPKTPPSQHRKSNRLPPSPSRAITLQPRENAQQPMWPPATLLRRSSGTKCRRGQSRQLLLL